jgi:hypothetical protein
MTLREGIKAGQTRSFDFAGEILAAQADICTKG